jgi:tRNA A58 N-methylase Trm61
LCSIVKEELVKKIQLKYENNDRLYGHHYKVNKGASSRMNTGNFPFYKNLGVKILKEMASRVGIDHYVDVKQAYQHIKGANSILELGAGYGRCLDYLLLEGYKGELIAVEYVPEYVDYLKNKFGTRVNVIDGDIQTDAFSLDHKVDAAMWLWSGFSDFSKEEQDFCLQKIYHFLNHHGKLIIDIPKIENNLSVVKLMQNTSASELLEKNQNFIEGKDVVWETPYGIFRGYIQSRESMRQIATMIGFKKVTYIEYKTETNIERLMCVLEK